MQECGYILEENSQYSRQVVRDDKQELDLILTTMPERPNDKIRDENLSLPQLIGRYSGNSRDSKIKYK